MANLECFKEQTRDSPFSRQTSNIRSWVSTTSKSLCLRSSNVQDSDRNLPPYLSSNRHVAVKYRPTVIMTKILNEQLKEPKKQTNSNQSNRLWNPVEPSIEISPFTLKNLQLYCQIPLLSDHYCNSTTAS